MMKYTALTDSLYHYVRQHRKDADDLVLKELREVTQGLGDDAVMQIGEDQGAFFSILVAALNVREALEIGTFTGYSSLCIARALPQNGRLTCLDLSEEWTSIARRFWQKAGVDGKIDLKVGPALESLKAMTSVPRFDFVFIDADKTSYGLYYEMVLPMVRDNGLIVFDNMLRDGRVLAPKDANDEAIRVLNDRLTADPRIENVLLPVADGLQICRKRPSLG